MMHVMGNNLIWAHKKLFMAEDEIRKHAKAAYKAWNDPHKSWKNKLKETLLEIVIIVFPYQFPSGCITGANS